jgi:hypothetical protein
MHLDAVYAVTIDAVPILLRGTSESTNWIVGIPTDMRTNAVAITTIFANYGDSELERREHWRSNMSTGEVLAASPPRRRPERMKDRIDF